MQGSSGYSAMDNLAAEIRANIDSINVEAAELKRAAKQNVENVTVLAEIERKLCALKTRSDALEHNLELAEAQVVAE
jgi:hypothetical protein